MKKKIMFALAFILTAAIFSSTQVVAAESTCSTEEISNAIAKVTTMEGTQYCQNLNDALSAVTNSGTVTLLQDVNDNTSSASDQYAIREGSKIEFTLDLGGHSITSNGSQSTLTIDGSNVTIKNGTITNTVGTRGLWIKKGEVTIDGVTINTKENGSRTTAIEVGTQTWSDTEAGSKVTVINSNLNSRLHGIVISSINATVTFESGTIDAVSGTGIATFNASSGDVINVNGGYIKGSTGVGLIGRSGKLTVTGGTIEATGYTEGTGIAINSNNSANNLDIQISGGYVKGVIGLYKPGKGTLSVSGGTIEGEIGIVARQGEVTISGGTIIAIGDPEDTHAVGDMNHQLPSGMAVVVDNESTSYGADIQVDIKGGRFEATNSTTLYSYTNSVEGKEKDTNDYLVSGGSFSQPFTTDYVAEDYLELAVTRKDDTNWYVGKEAEAAVEEAKNDGTGTTIDVLQGDLTIVDAMDGLHVINSGTGEVNVNDDEVTPDSDVTVIVNITVTVDNKKYETEQNTKFGEFRKANQLPEAKYVSEDGEEITDDTILVKDIVLTTVKQQPVDSDEQSTETEPNPDTYDASMSYMSLALIALGTMTVSIRKLRNN